VDQEGLITRTIELARANVEEGGRPFACVIARDGDIVAESPNRVAQTHDPTAHAEVLAIRAACMALGTESLEGCEVYALAHPCPMCLGALYYCSPDRFVFVTAREDYVAYYRDDRKYFELDTFYAEYPKPYQERRLPMAFERRDEALAVYRRWAERNA
jgi:guanine deaminase